MKTRMEQTRQARRIHGGWCNLFGATLGVRLARCPVPQALRPRVYRALYGKKYDALNEDDLEKPLDSFRSINELFTRGVKHGRRPVVENAEHHFAAPCDGTVQDIGRLQNDTILTVKGIPYQLSSLAPTSDVNDFNDGHFAILFLSPRDCHRVFSPQTGNLTAMTHVPGYRLLVHPPYQRPEYPVFTLNERLIMELSTSLGRCLLIMVAGWGVGHITHPFETGLQPHSRRVTRVDFESPRPVSTADWLATFELGSTVILITENSRPLTESVQRDGTLLYGESLFCESNFS